MVFIDHGGEQDPRARQRLAGQGLQLHAVLTIEQITDILEEAGRINAAQAAELRHGDIDQPS